MLLHAHGTIEALRPHQAAFAAIRRELHAHPETGYEEVRTSNLIAAELESYGLAVHRGIARTGVAGVLRAGNSNRSIGLRADIDALNIREENECAYRSVTAGKMHACGHDGHTTMLLLAAKHLSSTRNFDGTVIFIFQPAEEGGAGGLKMIKDGLFERFPVQTVYGMHNIPGIPVGHFAVMPGPMMAAADAFDIVLTGRGGHAAMPHQTADTILAASALVQQLQSLISRNLDPLEPAVLSVTQIHGGEARNIIPTTVTLRGTVRAYSKTVRQLMEAGIQRVSAGVAASYGVESHALYYYGYPPTINTPREAAFARNVLQELVGKDRVLTELKPLMTGEDFAYLLEQRPGAYIWIGNGPTAGLHTPRYDFNDDILTLGAAYWVNLAQSALDVQPLNQSSSAISSPGAGLSLDLRQERSYANEHP